MVRESSMLMATLAISPAGQAFGELITSTSPVLCVWSIVSAFRLYVKAQIAAECRFRGRLPEGGFLFKTQDAVGGDVLEALNRSRRPCDFQGSRRGFRAQPEMQPQVAGREKAHRTGHV